MTKTDRGLTWTTSPKPARELRRAGYTVVSYRDIRTNHIEPARSVTARRLSLDNAAVSLLRLLDDNPRLAILDIPTRTAGDLSDIYSFLVEPAFRRDASLLLGVDRSLDALDAAQLVAPEMGYAWSHERLVYIAQRYLHQQRSDGLPPLTPIESQLLAGMRGEALTPQLQYGIGRFRVDFAFPAQRLVVEADGRAWHDAERDADRDAYLATLGWQTLRFSGSEIYRDANGIAKRIARALDDRSSTVTYTDLPPVPHLPWWRRFIKRILSRGRQGQRAITLLEVHADRPVPEWKAHLDKDQRRAVDAHEGVVQVIAPAGSGKTTTMTMRVQELIARGVAANRILCTTFSRATRDELDNRLKAQGISGAEVRNFHSLGRIILREEQLLRAKIGTASYGQWRRISKQAMDSLADGVWLDAPVASELVSNYKLAHMWDPQTASRHAVTPTERTAASIYSLYEEYLESVGRHDFDDLILRAVQLLQNDPNARRRWQDRWECVLVDEYQDIEPAQELLIRLVAAPEDSIFAVGDEDQCIYSWRRASVERIVMLDTLYPGLYRVVLGTSYRCPAKITDAARQLITNNKRRFPKDIHSSPISPTSGEIQVYTTDNLSEGAEKVAAILKDHTDPLSVVVLARTSRLLRKVAQACISMGIAVRGPGLALRATDAEKTLLAYLRLASAPQAADQADIRQSFRVPNRYLPQDAEAGLVSSLRGGASFAGAVGLLKVPASESWRQGPIEEWASLCTLLASTSDAAGAIQFLRTSGGLDRHYSSVEQMTPHDQIEVEVLGDLETEASGVALKEFVTMLELRSTVPARRGDKEGIELATIHGAKGREWDEVILFAADADQLPHFRALAETQTAEELDEAIEDERRLAYVAVTRTRRQLTIVTTSPLSPFLREAGIVEVAAPLPTRQSIDAAKAAQESAAVPSTVGEPNRQESDQLLGKPQLAPVARAKYPGTCTVCGDEIRLDNPIIRSDDRWVHEQCAER